MTANLPQPKYRKDYRPPAYLVDRVDLRLDIRNAHTDVETRLAVRRNPQAEADDTRQWRLNGRAMTLQSVALDGRELAEDEYTLDDDSLTLAQPPASFDLIVRNRIEPDANTALEGFYRSGDILCSQCEAEGFSRITYFPDRPDILARYRTTLVADHERYPVLLSNGDCVERGEAGEDRHYAVWEDPYPKPCYLFAAVAGDLACIEDSHTTSSGRPVAIRFYTEHGNESLCRHAVESLRQAMAWDERTYGLEYDLDTYMIVAVGSFNMGAMENKGLNIFNTACVLASPETATDRDFATVRDVVAHEYFHNYTGNRVTCRDWFQLSLKESLTVFREQQFAAEHDSPGLLRIQQARMLRNLQFPEDAGPTAHPVRPESYIEMNNFYTITIYEKGAEVIRMLHTILGHEAFTAGVRHYLDKFDGQAVTIEDFVAALEESAQADLSQFRLWYSQAGTPRLSAKGEYDPDHGRYSLTLSQQTPPTPGQKDKQPLHIPVACALLPADRRSGAGRTQLLHLREAEQTWTFDSLDAPPVVSLLRGFSAPVKLRDNATAGDLARLAQGEDDAFACWEALQRLYLEVLTATVEDRDTASRDSARAILFETVETLLAGPQDDDALLAEMLSLPGEAYLAEQFEAIDVPAVVAAHDGLRQELARRLAAPFRRLLDECALREPYRFTPRAAGRRRLAAVALDYLAALDSPEARARCLDYFRSADNMTDTMAALSALRDLDCAERERAYTDFERRWMDDPLVLDKWFSLQAASRIPDALQRVEALLEHPRFSLANPNRVRALLGSFARANMPAFHREDGAGYRFIADRVLELDRLNPQIAARLSASLSRWRRYRGRRSERMRAELTRIRDTEGLSSDVHEIVAKSLDED